jgi:hypothetical protein
MRNYKGAFYRTDEISREPDDQCPDWIDLLATKMASSKTAVEVARDRQHQPSIYEMMSAIVSGQKPKYSSVEEAVKDYQRQTGLDEYMKRASESDLSAIASEIIAKASEDDEDEDEEEEDKDEEDDDEDEEDEDEEEEEDEDDGDKDDAIDAFRRNLDYGEARDMTEEELQANPGKKKLISEADDAEKPDLLVENPAIEHFLNNVIETNIGIQMPAILHSLIETFSRDGVDHRIFSDRELLDWINGRLINKGVARNDVPSHIGRGVGTHVDYSGDKDSNKDPFTLLEPDKGHL